MPVYESPDIHATGSYTSDTNERMKVRLSGGHGNTDHMIEIHVKVMNDDGKIVQQGWLPVAELLREIERTLAHDSYRAV